MGLPIVEYVLGENNAEIDIESEVGKGTTVKIWFPIA